MILIIQRISKKANNEHASGFSNWALISCKTVVSTAFLNINRRSISSTLHPHLSTNFEASPELISSTGFSSIQFQIKTHFWIVSMQKKIKSQISKSHFFFIFNIFVYPEPKQMPIEVEDLLEMRWLHLQIFSCHFKLLQEYENMIVGVLIFLWTSH